MRLADHNMKLVHKFYLYLYALVATLLIPFHAYAIGVFWRSVNNNSVQVNTFKTLVDNFVGFFNTLILLIFSFAFLAFIWGVAQYIVFPGNEERKQKGKNIIVWGIIVFVVMISVWGIVNLLSAILL